MMKLSQNGGVRDKPGLPLVPQALLVTMDGDLCARKGDGAFLGSILRLSASLGHFLRLAVAASKSTLRHNFHDKVSSIDAIEEVRSGCFDGSLHFVDFDCSEEVQSLEGLKVL